MKCNPLRRLNCYSSITLLLLAILTVAGCTPSKSPRPRIKVGIQTSPAMALVMTAKDRGLFDAEGIDVELQPFSAGKFALQAFLGGSLDFAVAGEVPVTLATLQGNKVSVVTQVVVETRDEVRVVARREGNLTDAGAYFRAKKRRLATSFGGGPEFFTYNFLKEYNLKREDVDVLPLKPEEMSAALTAGSVDAISIFDPFAFIAERQMGEKGITFKSKLYSEFYVWVCRPGDLDARRDTLLRILRALNRAAEDVAAHPEEAQRSVVRYTQLTEDVVAGIWKNFVFAPALNQKLVETMAAEAQWAREKGDVPANTALPDFRRQVIAEEPLRAVAPASVRLP